MPTSGSSSRSSATRCSAERPCSPNASRSPRTMRTRLSAVTRPSAAEPPPVSRSPVWQGSSRAASWSITPSRKRASTSLEADGEVGHAGPAARHHVEGVVLVGGEPDRGRLHPQRHVLGDEHDRAPAVAAPLGGEVERAGQDAAVVGVGTKSRGEHLRVGVVELDVQRAARVADRHGRVQPPVLDAQVVERPQRRAGEPPQLGVVPLALQLGDHHQRQDDLVLVEPGQRPRVGQQDGGVEHVAAPGFRALCASSRFGHGCSLVGAAPRPLSGGPACPGPDLRDDRRGRPRGPVAGPLGCVTPRPGPPRAVRIGYGPPRQTLPAVTRVRSTATPCRRRVAPPELTQRTTVRRLIAYRLSSSSVLDLTRSAARVADKAPFGAYPRPALRRQPNGHDPQE